MSNRTKLDKLLDIVRQAVENGTYRITSHALQRMEDRDITLPEVIRAINMNRNSVEYKALGFPIIILNPSYIEFEGEKVLDISPKRIMDAAFEAVIQKPSRLSGAEIKFLRGYMELSQEAFGRLVNVDHSTVAKWELKKLTFTGMDVPTEALIRMRCKLHINKRDRIGDSFIESLMTGPLSTKDVGPPIEIAA